MKTSVVHILTRRNLTSTVGDAVYAHEVPILKVARGAGNVSVQEEHCTQFCLKPIEVRPRDELIRLKKKYQGFAKDGQQNPVDIAFPDGSRDLELFYEDPGAFALVGEEDGGGMITDDFDLLPEVAPDVNDELDVVVEGPDVSPDARGAIVDKLTQLGVPFAKTTPTVHLQALLDRSVDVEKAE